jgi:hypothetical protein
MDTPTRWQRLKQKIYIVTPLFLLIFCLGLINFVPRWMGDREPAESTASPVLSVSDDGRAPATTAVPILSPSTTPPPTMTPSPTPYPTLPAGAAITLLGPPHDGRFRAQDTISFYWDWPVPLLDDQFLAVYVRQDGQDIQLGTLDEPNLGQRYRIQVAGQTIATAAETNSVQWLVRLQSAAQSQTSLMESETRTLTIMP